MNTRYYKDHDNNWTAKTFVSMPNNMELSIRTCKGNNGIVTVTSVGHITADGLGVCTGCFDYCKLYLAPTFKASRATEEVIKEAHELVLLELENIKLKVIAFYKARPELIQRPDVTE